MAHSRGKLLEYLSFDVANKTRAGEMFDFDDLELIKSETGLQREANLLSSITGYQYRLKNCSRAKANEGAINKLLDSFCKTSSKFCDKIVVNRLRWEWTCVEIAGQPPQNIFTGLATVFLECEINSKSKLPDEIRVPFGDIPEKNFDKVLERKLLNKNLLHNKNTWRMPLFLYSTKLMRRKVCMKLN